MLISFKEPTPFYSAFYLTNPHERKHDTEFHCLAEIPRNNLLEYFFLICECVSNAEVGCASTL